MCHFCSPAKQIKVYIDVHVYMCISVHVSVRIHIIEMGDPGLIRDKEVKWGETESLLRPEFQFLHPESQFGRAMR